MTTNAEQAVRHYLDQIRQTRSTGHATEELSFYPAVNALLASLGTLSVPKREPLANPAGIEGDLPDVALYETASKVLVLPVEVKPTSWSLDSLLASDQARRYARSFGGGRVLLTNLWAFSLARISGDCLEEVDRVQLVPSEGALDHPFPDVSLAAESLVALLEAGCAVRSTLRRPAQVASLLAYHARHMVQAIEAAGSPKDLLAPIAGALRDGLEVDLEEAFLVPTVVQTLVYGIFAAWLQGSGQAEFDWMGASYRLDVPVFAEVLHEAVRPALVRRCNLIGHLDATARVLAWVDRSEFVDAFDGGAIEYFYEPFLARFDPHLRDRLGVWYTPSAIATYQVARADHHLREDLGLVDGLADESVLVLDPAVGTGTYLAAVLERIRRIHLDNGEPVTVAAARAREAATTRVIGFEILPAAFVICHLHLARLLAGWGAGLEEGTRPRIYLTNSLTGWGEGPSYHSTLFPELEEQLAHARLVKKIEPVLVVLGNPPYEGYSSAESSEEKALVRPWISPLWSEWGLRKHRLNDLYVRFWRIAIERIASLTGRGVVSFITNRKWLGGRSYPTMREAVVTQFDQVVVDDLHGGTDDTTHSGDQSIFTTATAVGIKRGTAIVTAIRQPAHVDGVAAVCSRDLWGTAQAKRDRLLALAGSGINDGQEVVVTSKASRWRLREDPGGDYPSVEEYFSFYVSGVQPVKVDEVVMDEDRSRLEAAMEDYFDPDLPWEQLIIRHPSFGVTRARYRGKEVRATLLGLGYLSEHMVRFLYRPLDTRWLYWETRAKLLNEPRRELWPYFRLPGQRAIVAPQVSRRQNGPRPIVTTVGASYHAAEPDARVLPLLAPGEILGTHEGMLGHETGPLSSPLSNIRPGWITAARQAGVPGDDLAVADAVFHAIVAVQHSPGLLSSLSVELDDFAPAPLPANLEDLMAASELGRRIADLVDPDRPVPGVTTGALNPAVSGVGVPDAHSGPVTLVYGQWGRAGGLRSGTAVLWSGDQGWRGISDEVWSYTLCGHAVLPKWLSYRVGRPLTQADRERFMHVARRVAALVALGNQSDSIFSSASNAPLELVAAAEVSAQT